MNTNGRSTSWRASAPHTRFGRTAHAVRVRSLRIRPTIRTFSLQGGDALGQVIECSRGIAWSRFVDRRMGYFHWGSPPQCFELAFSMQRITAPSFPLRLLAVTNCHRVLLHSYIGDFHNSLEFDHLDVVLDVSSRSTPGSGYPLRAARICTSFTAAHARSFHGYPTTDANARAANSKRHRRYPRATAKKCSSVVTTHLSQGHSRENPSPSHCTSHSEVLRLQALCEQFEFALFQPNSRSPPCPQVLRSIGGP